MVNGGWRPCLAVLLLALAVLTAAAALRSAEYDEQYTLFLTAGEARPVWPPTPFAAGDVRRLQAGHASLGAIARDLRATDVHPPLYFWCVALWRRLAGSALLAARMFSVLCGVAAVAAVGAIAQAVGVPPALAMVLTLGCYGFAYTAAIARGFALAQALTLWGLAVLLSRGGRGRGLAAGALLGAATLTNYLAVFVPLTAIATKLMTLPAWRSGGIACATGIKSGAGCLPPTTGEVFAGLLPFLLADLWFFVAQRDSRAGQFPPFHVVSALGRLARYGVAAMFGGLPLYVPAPARAAVAAAVAMLAVATAVLVAVRWRTIGRGATGRWVLVVAAVAPPAGLLGLGIVFRTTPIELRYLAFACPFAALLVAGALGSLPRPGRHAAAALLLAVQGSSIAGMMTRPETMQPARATAAAASQLAVGGIVLVPRGNDGVGIVGAFAIELPPAQRLLVVGCGESAAGIRARLGDAGRVVLALLAQDDDSRTTLPAMRGAVAGPCWRRGRSGFDAAAFEQTCDGGAP